MENNLVLSTFLSMNGDAAEAIRFYEKHLNAQVVFLKTYQDMKAYDPGFAFEESQAGFISHSILVIGKSQLMVADGPVNGLAEISCGNSLSLCLESNDVQTVKDIYDALTGDTRTKVILPFEKSIFSEGYAVVVDPFGVVIQLNVDAK